MRYPSIERQLGLHQFLDIHYVVDGYASIIRNEDGYPQQSYEGHGDAVESSLAALDGRLSSLPPGFSMKHGKVFP